MMKMVMMMVIRMTMTIAVVIKMIDRSNNKYWPSIIASAYERESEKEYQETYCGVAFHRKDSILPELNRPCLNVKMLLTPKALQPYAFTVRLPHKDENLTLLILRIETFVFFNQHKRVKSIC